MIFLRASIDGLQQPLTTQVVGGVTGVIPVESCEVSVEPTDASHTLVLKLQIANADNLAAYLHAHTQKLNVELAVQRYRKNPQTGQDEQDLEVSTGQASIESVAAMLGAALDTPTKIDLTLRLHAPRVMQQSGNFDLTI